MSGSADEGAGNLLECFLVSYSSHLLFRRVPDNPNVWTGGSIVLDEVSGASSAGSSTYAHVLGYTWRHREWEHLDMEQSARGNVVDSLRGFCSVP